MKPARLHPLMAVALAASLLFCMAYGVRYLSAGLLDTDHITGWILVTLVVLLTTYGWRKRLSVLPLGGMIHWSRVHLVLGFLVIPLFLFHSGKLVPNGVMDSMLAGCFWLVAISGLIGLWWGRSFPHRLTRRGEEVLYEAIPGLRRAVQQAAEDLVITVAGETGSTTLADYYHARLRKFFDRSCNHHEHLLDWNRSRFALLNDLGNLRRYLNDREMEALQELERMVVRKDDLDYHCTLQGGLKLWLMVHVPLTHALLVLAAWHMVNVLGFQG
ncbi:MAG: hypothetical protein HQL82_04120 [Magnetococcales bacterium]|nr:hypothetical protein [Magnetococcales bacterium]